MDARAKAAKNPELVEKEFTNWIKYYDDNQVYAHTINTVDDYVAELKGLIDVATAIHCYLLSPAGSHHNAYAILGFQCAMECVYDQIVDALNAAPIPNKEQVFSGIKFDVINKPLSTEWAWIKFHLNKLQKLAKAKEVESETTLAQVVISKLAQPSSITRPVTIAPKFSLRSVLNFLQWSEPLPASGSVEEPCNISRPVKVGS